MGIACSMLPLNNGNFPLPFFGGNYPIFLLHNIFQGLYISMDWFTWIIFIHDCICNKKLGVTRIPEIIST